MRYVSTRSSGEGQGQPFSAILLEGLAADGGLFVPERYPRYTPAELAALRPLGYADLAFSVLSSFIDDIPSIDLRRIIADTYTRETFGSDDITPVTRLENGLYLLRTANGPTLSFKDIALQLVGNLFEYVLVRDGRSLNVLGATSGDTGSSAEHALRGKRGINVFMLSPKGRMTPFQAAQMFALSDPNICNVEIDGTFDACQDIVKAIAGDAAFKARFKIGAVNSINWARVAAQVVYYFKGYFAATADDTQRVDFAVPSGNFGNILAGHVAREMGLPIRRLILATNENDVLDEFFRIGRYRPRPASETFATSSPSMDITRASNFERFVHDLADRNGDVVRRLWQELGDRGAVELRSTPLWERVERSGIVSGKSTHADRLATIRSVAQRFGVVVDPHTADGLKVGGDYRDDATPLICIETALPVKFAATIRAALGRAPDIPSAFADLELRPQRKTEMPADSQRVKAFIAHHARDATTAEVSH